jgi:hypothetical protein
MKRVGLIVAFAGVFAIPPQAVADQQADPQWVQEDLQRQEMLARQRRRYALEVRARTPVPQHQMRQIVRLALENRQLALHTSLSPVRGPDRRRADIDGLGSAVITYTQFIAGHPEASQFEFTIEDYQDPLTFGRIHLLWRPSVSGPGELEMESTRQRTHGRYWRVVFQQYPGQVLLIAYGSDNGSNRDAENLNLAGKSFWELRSRYPVELEKWLRPVLHRLQQDAVFAADSNAAWQALLDDWPLQPDTQQRIDRLIPQLNAADWATRNRAANDLAKLGRDGATAIARMHRDHLSIEQNVRLDEILSRFHPLTSNEVKPLRNNVNFLLDCEYSDDATVRKLAGQRLSQILGRPLDLNLDAPEAMRAQAIEKIRAEIKPDAE